MDDLISRKAVLSILHNKAFDSVKNDEKYNLLRWCIKQIESLPTIQPQGIDKNRLIEEIEKEMTWWEDFCVRSEDRYHKGATGGLAKAIELIKQQPTSDGWIPVSERLPDKDNSYEVTVEYANSTRTTTTLRFDKDWEEWHHAEATVIAWRERLLQPYKESE